MGFLHHVDQPFAAAVGRCGLRVRPHVVQQPFEHLGLMAHLRQVLLEQSRIDSVVAEVPEQRRDAGL